MMLKFGLSMKNLNKVPFYLRNMANKPLQAGNELLANYYKRLLDLEEEAQEAELNRGKVYIVVYQNPRLGGVSIFCIFCNQ